MRYHSISGRAVALLAVMVLTLLMVALAAPAAWATDFTVTNTNNSGTGSLRQAIVDTNNNQGADTIKFNIPGSGVKTISPTSTLPALTGQVIIDGYTQPGASENTLQKGNDAKILIELDGTNAGSSVHGLVLHASNSTLRGLVINRFTYAGIYIDAGTSASTWWRATF
jgi:hypothetical protein